MLVDEVADLVDREPSLGHVVLDEAQDLSPMQLRAVGRRCSTASATVLGDIAQGTTPWATTDWAESLAHLGKPAAHIEVLRRGYRVPAAVIEFAGRLLPHIAPGVSPPESVRENDGRLDLVPAVDLLQVVADEVRRVLDEPGSVGVVVADADVDRFSDALDARQVAHVVLGSDDSGDGRGCHWCRRRWPRGWSTTTSSSSSRQRSSRASRRRSRACAGCTSC